MTTWWAPAEELMVDLAPPSLRTPREQAVRHAAVARAIARLSAELYTLTPEAPDDCPACAQVGRIRAGMG